MRNTISLDSYSRSGEFSDLSVFNGPNGNYGSRTSDVYRYRPKAKKIIYGSSLASIYGSFQDMEFGRESEKRQIKSRFNAKHWLRGFWWLKIHGQPPHSG